MMKSEQRWNATTHPVPVKSLRLLISNKFTKQEEPHVRSMYWMRIMRCSATCCPTLFRNTESWFGTRTSRYEPSQFVSDGKPSREWRCKTEIVTGLRTFLSYLTQRLSSNPTEHGELTAYVSKRAIADGRSERLPPSPGPQSTFNETISRAL